MYFLFEIFSLFLKTSIADDVYSGVGPGHKMKAAAAYEALVSSGADIIVNPQYVIEKRVSPFFLTTSYDVTVTGFKGTISVSK